MNIDLGAIVLTRKKSRQRRTSHTINRSGNVILRSLTLYKRRFRFFNVNVTFRYGEQQNRSGNNLSTKMKNNVWLPFCAWLPAEIANIITTARWHWKSSGHLPKVKTAVIIVPKPAWIWGMNNLAAHRLSYHHSSVFDTFHLFFFCSLPFMVAIKGV